MSSLKTKLLKVEPITPSEEKIQEAAEVIRRGGLVAFPTETVYGLGANAFDASAVRKIFKAKGRPPDNPLIVHVSSLEEAKALVLEWTDLAKELAERFWPGPITLVLRKRNLPDEVTAGLPTVAVRFPAHPVALTLIKLSNTPIAAPSANLSGRPSPTTAEHVVQDLWGRIDYILDGGTTPFGVESTILDITRRPPILLRPGPIAPEDLERVVGRLVLSRAALGEEAEVAEAPGMKYRHYSPKARLLLVRGKVGRVVKVAGSEAMKGYRVGILTCDEHAHMYKAGVVISLGKLSNPYSIAHNLFTSLRKFDELGVDVIVAEEFPQKGILFAVNNRLRKAASEII